MTFAARCKKSIKFNSVVTITTLLAASRAAAIHAEARLRGLGRGPVVRSGLVIPAMAGLDAAVIGHTVIRVLAKPWPALFFPVRSRRLRPLIWATAS